MITTIKRRMVDLAGQTIIVHSTVAKGGKSCAAAGVF
jgi:hypothetical protein